MATGLRAEIVELLDELDRDGLAFAMLALLIDDRTRDELAALANMASGTRRAISACAPPLRLYRAANDDERA
jgi:hypothetical protein